jgi:dipeptidyl aminopeptidase/acylaminoacyl peptidase
MRIAVLALLAALAAGAASYPLHSQTPVATSQTEVGRITALGATLDSHQGLQGGELALGREPDFEKQVQQQAETDKTWRSASNGYMQMEKITYRSKAGDLDIPAFVFQPLKQRAAKGHPALVWVHENIRGHLYEHYIPYIREATDKGYVVIAPEYRGSVGYGKAFYDAIDYGGSEVDDVTTAVDVLQSRYPQVDPSRIGIIGWSHGGMIALLAIFRNPVLFKSAVAMVPVSNLFQRLAWKGVEKQKEAIDPQDRYGGLPHERHDVYKERSPLYHVDKLQIPLYVGVTKNDEDVNIEEDMQLVDALRSRKPMLAETRVYENPPGGHLFDRRVDGKTWQPENTREQRDSWNRVWTLLDWNLDPFHDASSSPVSTFHQAR